MRGSTVGTTIDVQDPAAADQIRSRMQELTHALESRGLEASTFRVRASGASESVLSADLARTAAPSGDPMSLRLGDLLTQAASSSSRSRGESLGQRPQYDQQRQRSRREQEGKTP
jgi:hypothetical protein